MTRPPADTYAGAPDDGTAVERALSVLADQLDGSEPLCRQDVERWAEPRNTREAEAAIDGCIGCRGLTACDAYARLLRPAVGVWAAQEWRSGRPRTRPTARRTA